MNPLAHVPGRHVEYPASRIAYAVAIAGTLGMVFLIGFLELNVGGTPVILFLVFVILSAYLGGIVPGLTATAIASATVAYVLLDPQFRLAIAEPVDQTRWVGLLLVGTLVSFSFEQLHRLRSDAKVDEEALRESEQHHRSLFRNMRNGLAYCRMLFQDGQPWDFVYLATNPAFEEQTGLKEVVGKKVSELIPGIRESDPALFDLYGRVVRTGVAEKAEIYLKALQHWFALSVYSPEPDHFVAVFDVVTDRKEAEKALKESEAALREKERTLLTLLSNLPGMAYRYANDRNWTIQFVSQGCIGLTGYAPSDFIENKRISYAQIVHPADRGQVWDAIQELVKQREPYELVYRIIMATGEEKWVWEQGQGVFSPEGDLLALEGFVSEIASRKKAERILNEKVLLEGRLSQSEERLQSLVANIPDVTWTADSTGRIHFISPNVERVLGYTPDEIYASSQEIWFETIDPRDVQRVKEAFETLFSKAAQFDIECRQRKKDGTWIWVHDRAMTVYERDGVLCADGIFSDISSRKHTEDLLQQQADLQQQLSRIVSASPGVVFSYRLRPDGSSCMPFASTRIQDLVGISPEVLAKDASPAFERVHEDDLPLLREAIRNSAQALSPLLYEFRITNPEKGQVWIEGRGIPERQADGSVLWHGVLTDATERKRLEQQFQQAQKMEAVGLLAGGVAHDFNNILGVILGYSDMLLEEFSPDDPKHERLVRIKRSSERGTSLVRQLLTFSRKSVHQPKVLNLNAVVRLQKELDTGDKRIR